VYLNDISFWRFCSIIWVSLPYSRFENFGRTLCSLNKVSRPENHLKTWCIWIVLIFGYFVKYFMYLIHIQIRKTLGEHHVPWTRFLDWKTLVNLNVFKGYQNLLNLLNTLCIYVISQVYSKVGNNPLFPVIISHGELYWVCLSVDMYNMTSCYIP